MAYMQMTRSFNAVGQGVFCTETFLAEGKKYHFVFDCGSSTKLNLVDGTSAFVDREIALSFEQGEEIESVFISHFDREHMNGLEQLLREHPVKKLFLPALSEECKALTSLKARIEFGKGSGAFVQKLLKSPMSFPLDKNYRVEQVVLVEEEPDGGQGTEKNVLDFEEAGCAEGSVVSNSVLLCRLGAEQPVWKYVLTNFREESKILKLERALKQMGLSGWQDSREEWDSYLWEEHRGEIIEIFMGIDFEDFNTNSLVVYSGKASDSIAVEMQPLSGGQCWGMCKSFFQIRPGCMYMGDYDSGKRARWNQIKSAYREEWGSISVWLLPHHGSPQYFYHDMAFHDAEIYIACAGTRNQHQHPGKSVIKKLQLTGKLVYQVDEKPENRVAFLYKLSWQAGETPVNW